MNSLRVVVLVSPDTSDIYFANQLARQLNVVGVFVEKQQEPETFGQRLGKWLKLFKAPAQLQAKFRERKIFQDHYARTGAVDRTFFGEDGVTLQVPEGCHVVHTEGVRALSQPVYVKQIKSLKPDVIAVCGSSILKGEILQAAPLGILNLHGGLAQRYRGIWTTLWAVVRNEPEYIGATVHYVSPGIDDGDIVYQGRPEVAPEDDPQSLYAKVVKLGVEMMCRAVNDIESQSVKSYPLNQKGDLYLGKMVNGEVISKAWDNIERGILADYLKEKERRDRPVLELMRGSFSSIKETS